uniref:ANF_receptor domain-containing protein n=1 Tax=Heligmosomoides polygyrus TaxID=6339 RepID=A0A183GUQ3_HELPZ
LLSNVPTYTIEVGQHSLRLANAVVRGLNPVDLDPSGSNASQVEAFKSRVVARVRADPLYCATPACLNNTGQTMGSFARHLHDAFYMYASSLAKADAVQPDGRKNASTMKKAMEGTFQGLTGTVTVGANSSRVPNYVVYGLDRSAEQQTFIRISFVDETDVNLVATYADESTSIWATRDGKRPLTTPLCGYSGTDCPLSFWEQYLIYIAVGGSLALLLLITLLCLATSLVRAKRQAMMTANAEWQIPFLTLAPVKSDGQSRRSLQSGPSTITKDSTFHSEDSKFELYSMNKEPVLVTKHNTMPLTRSKQYTFIKVAFLVKKVSNGGCCVQYLHPECALRSTVQILMIGDIRRHMKDN